MMGEEWEYEWVLRARDRPAAISNRPSIYYETRGGRIRGIRQESSSRDILFQCGRGVSNVTSMYAE